MLVPRFKTFSCSILIFEEGISPISLLDPIKNGSTDQKLSHGIPSFHGPAFCPRSFKAKCNVKKISNGECARRLIYTQLYTQPILIYTQLFDHVRLVIKLVIKLVIRPMPR